MVRISAELFFRVAAGCDELSGTDATQSRLVSAIIKVFELFIIFFFILSTGVHPVTQ